VETQLNVFPRPFKILFWFYYNFWIPNKVIQIQQATYIPFAPFILPENCWTEDFYAPQVTVQEEFIKVQVENKMAEDFIANQRHETQLYYKYKAFYGYVFYIGQKI